MKAENMKFSKLVVLSPIGPLKQEIFASKDKRAFFLGHPVDIPERFQDKMCTGKCKD